MRNPFFKVICNRGNFTREMKNPFEFAKELLRYTRGELSKEEEKGIEQVLLEVKGMNTLVEELRIRTESSMKCILLRSLIRKGL